jgi:altronate dehydratase large subunit
MLDNIDINAGTVLENESTLQSIGDDIFTEIIEVARGKLVKAELLGHREFAIHTIGPTV